MRDVKFRAFHEKYGMSRPFSPFSDHLVIFETFTKTYAGSVRNHTTATDKSLSWIQYTGLTDARGVEIYEGDVVRGDLFDRELPIAGRVVFDKIGGCYALENDAGLTFLFKVDDISVIGNIYENSDMMEGES